MWLCCCVPPQDNPKQAVEAFYLATLSIGRDRTDARPEFLDRIRKRDPQAVADLVLRHHLQLRGYVAALCADVSAIDDLAQEVFVRGRMAVDRNLRRELI